jgi:hypothetical protein
MMVQNAPGARIDRRDLRARRSAQAAQGRYVCV